VGVSALKMPKLSLILTRKMERDQTFRPSLNQASLPARYPFSDHRDGSNLSLSNTRVSTLSELLPSTCPDSFSSTQSCRLKILKCWSITNVDQFDIQYQIEMKINLNSYPPFLRDCLVRILGGEEELERCLRGGGKLFFKILKISYSRLFQLDKEITKIMMKKEKEEIVLDNSQLSLFEKRRIQLPEINSLFNHPILSQNNKKMRTKQEKCEKDDDEMILISLLDPFITSLEDEILSCQNPTFQQAKKMKAIKHEILYNHHKKPTNHHQNHNLLLSSSSSSSFENHHHNQFKRDKRRDCDDKRRRIELILEGLLLNSFSSSLSSIDQMKKNANDKNDDISQEQSKLLLSSSTIHCENSTHNQAIDERQIDQIEREMIVENQEKLNHHKSNQKLVVNQENDDDWMLETIQEEGEEEFDY